MIGMHRRLSRMRCDMEYTDIREANDNDIKNLDLNTLLEERDDEREYDECFL